MTSGDTELIRNFQGSADLLKQIVNAERAVDLSVVIMRPIVDLLSIHFLRH